MSNHAVFLAGLKVSGNGRATGAHRIATFLRKQDWDVEVLDFVTAWSNDQLKEFLLSRVTANTKMIGYSYTFHTWEDRFHEIFSWVREKWPQVKIVVGGVGVETCPINAHYFINNYAEYAILEVIKNILGTNTEKLKYTLFRNGKLIRANLDYPAYPMQDLRVSYEPRDFIDPRETLVVETCRGCIFKCDFCTYPILGVKDDHTVSAETYIAHLQEDYDRWGVTHWNVADETFNDRTDKIEKFANATAKLNFKPNLTGFIRADLMVSRKQDWPLLEAMGFWGHWYGIESFNHASAKSIGKGMKSERIKEGLLEVKDYFLKRGPYIGSMSFIVGLPHETEEMVRENWEWLKLNWAGQSAIYYALFIPKPEHTEEMSTLSKTWQEKGYREMQNNISFTPQHTGMGAAGTYYLEGLTTGVRWETDHLDFERAHRLVDEFCSFAGDSFAINNFMMTNYRLVYGDSKEWMNRPFRNYHNITNEAQFKWQAEYIEKKLNWRS